MESVEIKTKKVNSGRPALKKKFDVTNSFYAKRGAASPTFEVSLRGDVEIDLLKLACVAGAAAIICAVTAIAASFRK